MKWFKKKPLTCCEKKFDENNSKMTIQFLYHQTLEMDKKIKDLEYKIKYLEELGKNHTYQISSLINKSS